MQWIYKIALIALCMYWAPRFCHDKTDGFTMMRIQTKLNKSLATPISTPPPSTIFSQKFKYLASGGQAYAFVSADDQYVLKFFKHHRHFLPIWRKMLPGSLLKKQKRESKRQRDLESYRLCMEILPQETGLLYLHLDETDHLQANVRILDKLGIAHLVNLDTTAFILQKRAILAYDYLNELIEKQEIDQAQAALASICDLVISRCQKGIFDEDPRVHRNFGFVDGKAILIDVGRLKRDPRRVDPRIYHSDLKKITARLKHYLEKHSPQLADFLDEHLESRV